MKTRRILLLTVGMLFLIGCARVEPLRTPYTAFGPADSAADLVIGVAVSGGGSRAALFAAAVLEELAKIPVGGDRPRSLLQDVAYVSSVSGGSLATAYYAARKPEARTPVLDPGKVAGSTCLETATGSCLSPAYQAFFAQFKADMQQDFEWSAAWRQVARFRAFNPTKLAYSLADVWDREFFHGVTFADLAERERRGDSPRIILNGTSYNSGRRFVFTTLPASAFAYPANGLLDERLKPLTFESLNADLRPLRLSLAVASSASFPPVVGPVTYSADNKTYLHIGDGGLFDNQGDESLGLVLLETLRAAPAKKGLLILIDAAFPFAASYLDGEEKGFEVFARDPGRIVGIMEQRALAYQSMFWEATGITPEKDRLALVILRHTGAEWAGYQDLPDACRVEFPANATAQDIKKDVSEIQTLFRVTPCHAALLMQAAKRVVAEERATIQSLADWRP